MVFFIGAYVASALRRLWPSPVSDWLVRNQRYLGFSLGVSHAAHAVFLVRLFSRWEPFDPAGAVAGLTGYVLLALMLATSNEPGLEMLGERGWRRLHVVGMHYLWVAFTYTMAASLAGDPSFQKAVFTLIGFAALGVRVAGARKARRAGVLAPAPAGP